MGLLMKLSVMKQVISWVLNKGKIDLDYKPKGVNSPRFKTGREAATLIPDNAVIVGCGMTASMRPATCYHLVRDSFERTGHPANVTWISAGGAGARGKAPGSVEECCKKGLITWFISGHHETVRAVLDMADRGEVTLSVIPQGTITHLIDAQGRGEDSVLTDVGVGTFVDPRVGTGTQVEPGKGPQLVEVEGDRLRYRIPKITATALMATYADADGNIYMKDTAMYTEVREGALAARANGGVVIISVAGIIPRDDSAIFLRADQVDAIVVNPRNEQTLMIPQLTCMKEFTLGQNADMKPTMERLNMFNKVTKLDPVRGPVEHSLARQAASVFASIGYPGVRTVIGYGLPQEVCRLAEEYGLGKDITFMIETGVIGGTPAPGFFFGMAVNPKKLITSAEMFHHIEENLDVTILGMLQVDAEGNVNVSKKSPAVKEYVGPGGFVNLVTYARNIIFVGQWMARAEMALEAGKLTIRKPGIPKFVEKVEEITFSAREAFKKGQNIYYCTNVGSFRLTERGVELFQVAPGIDIQRDILDAAPGARIVLPLDGKVEVLDPAILTGDGFRLRWSGTKAPAAPKAPEPPIDHQRPAEPQVPAIAPPSL
jgi:propionate CoA-transferase